MIQKFDLPISIWKKYHASRFTTLRRNLLGMRIGTIGLICLFVCIMLSSKAQTDVDIQSRLPEFERLVAAQRSRIGGSDPVRMVVYEKDHSSFVTSNSFELVVYDETDKIDQNPKALTGYWPYPGSSTGVADAGFGRKSVERIVGHFYRIWAADP